MPRWHRLADALATTRYPALLGYAMAFTGERAAAHEFVRESLERTFGRPRRLRDLRHAEHHVRQSIAATYADDRRREALLARAEAARPQGVGPGEPDADPDVVGTVLADLTPLQRACVIARYHDDLTVPRAAAYLGLAETEVIQHLRDAADALRTGLGIDIDPDEDASDMVTVDIVDHRGRGF